MVMVAEYDAFFSYRRKDLARAKPLLAALEAAGVRVWRDENDLPDYAPITPEIRNAIARSKTLIAFYSLDYPLSDACFQELTAAWIAVQEAGERPYSRILILNPEPSFDHIPEVLREQQLIRWPRDAFGFITLAHRIRDHISALIESLDKATKPARPLYHPAPLIASPRFVGRIHEMWELHAQLTADRIAIITGVFGPPVAQVRGIGGNGKSMLAREYAIRFGAAFPGGVFWLNAYGNDDSKGALDGASREALRRDQVRGFAVRCEVAIEELDDPQEIETAFWERLKDRGQLCLWIVDDLPSGLGAGEIEAFWAARWAGASTLITTRSTEYRSIGNGIDLEMLAEGEAFQLLTSRRSPQTASERCAAVDILHQLGCHPLAVEVAGSYLARGFATYEKYLSELKEANSEAVEFGAELRELLPTGHERSISSTLLRSVRMLGPDGLAFLQLAAVLAVAPIPVTFVEAVFNHLPEPQPRAIGGIDEVDSLSLTKLESDGARTVHTLVSRTVRDVKLRRAAAQSEHLLRSAAVEVLLEQLPNAAVDVRRRGEIRRELVHARHLITGKLDDPRIIDITAWVARHDLEGGDYGTARRLFERVLDANRRLLGTEHPDTLAAMLNLAETVKAQGELAGARELQQQALDASRRLLDAEHPDTLTAMNNLAGTVYAQGDLARARELQEQVLGALQRLLGAEHPDTLSAMSNLAETLYAQGEIGAAPALFEQVLAARRRLLGSDHPDTLTAMSNLAETLYAQGDQAARALFEQVLDARRRLLGSEHPDTLTAMLNVAGTMYAQGELPAARELQQQILDARRRLLGAEHPDTLPAMNNLALTVYAQGDLAAARELQQEVLELRRRLLGAEHADTLTAMNNLALTVYAQGDLAAARELQEQVLGTLERLLGGEHPDTLTAMNNLAQTLYSQGELAPARELLQNVLETRCGLLGTEHPDTSVAAWNLCCTLSHTGDFKRAAEIAKEYLEPLRSKPMSSSVYQQRILEMLGRETA